MRKREKVQRKIDSVFPRVEDLQGTVKNPSSSRGGNSKREREKPRKLIDDSDVEKERHRRETTLQSKFNYSRPSPSNIVGRRVSALLSENPIVSASILSELHRR